MDNLIVFVMGFVFIASYLIDLIDSFKRFRSERSERSERLEENKKGG